MGQDRWARFTTKLLGEWEDMIINVSTLRMSCHMRLMHPIPIGNRVADRQRGVLGDTEH